MGTSSGAIAAMLGYQDGEEMSFSELEYIIKRIVKNVHLPLSVDLEAGYSRHPDEVVDHITRLVQLGVVGINLEDSLANEQRKLINADDFSQQLETICTSLKSQGIDVFVNVRTDTFLLHCTNPVEETIKRAKQYEKAGADGIFVPCIEKEADIKCIVQATHLPLNVMGTPNLPDFQTLKTLGVKRISMGNFVHTKMLNQLENILLAIKSSGSFKPVFQ